jgi:hypothetical protein
MIFMPAQSANSSADSPASLTRQLPVIPPSPLPALYAAWIDQLLAGPLPQESNATCDDCAMLAEDTREQARSEAFFNPQTKCCTYVPELPNYLVGRILSDDDPAFASGRATVEERLHLGVKVTPLGLGQPPNFKLLYGTSAASLFGRSRSLRCPHYLANEGGRCGVWKHRASICATWYCKYVRGAVGMDFWKAMHQLLLAVEKSLSRWCVLELDIGAQALKHLFPPPAPPDRAGVIDPGALDGIGDPLETRMLWGAWAGRELEFYRECGRIVNALDWKEVTVIGGPELQIFARLLREAYAKLLSEKMPERLKVGPIEMISIDQDSCLITSYSSYDPLSVPRQLIEVLGHFDGRTTEEALESIAVAEGVTLDSTLLRQLTDFDVLIPAKIA